MSLKKLKQQTKKWLIGKEPPSNEDLLLPTDVFLVSYPRSGNTWCRTILAHLLYPDFELQKLAEVNDYIPGIHRPFPQNVPFSTPRVIKTHQRFYRRFRNDDPALYRKSIYVVRNVFDVVKSYYHYQKERKGIGEKSLDTFAREMAFGIYVHGSWQEHVLGWYGASQFYGEVLFVRYEDLLQDTVVEIERMAQFLGVEQSIENYQKIAKNSNIDQMRLAEKNGGFGKVPAFIRTQKERLPNLTLEQSTINLLLEHNQSAMRLFGYTADKINSIEDSRPH